MSNIKFYAPVDFDDTSSGLTINGDLTVDTNVLHVDTTNNKVGIGTTSPSQKLSVSGNVEIEGGDYNGLYFTNSANTTKSLLYQHANYDALVIKDIVNNSDRFVFKNNGNLLIGTTTDSGYKLDVSGSIHAQYAYIDNSIYHAGDTDTRIEFSNNRIQLLAAGATKIDTDLSYMYQGSFAASYTGDMDSLTGFRVIRSTAGTNRAFTGHHNVLQMPNTGASSYVAQLAFETGSTANGGIKYRNNAGGTFTDWYTVYNQATSLIPAADSTYDIGSSSVRFANGYFDTLYGDGSNLTGITATETDTLDSVTTRGSTTTNDIEVGGLNVEEGTLTVKNLTGSYGVANPTFSLLYSTTPYGEHGVGNTWNYIVNNPYGGASRGGIEFATQDITRMVVSKDGNVGINNTSPDTHLHINGTGAGASGNQYHLIVGDDNSYGINKGGGIIFRGDYNSSGAQANFGAIRAGKANANDGNANAYLSLLYGASGVLTEGLRVNYNGNVLIGTTTDGGQKLQVSGNAKVTGVFYTDYVQTLSGTSIDFRHQDASTIMRVDTANARVGIGTNSPQVELHVKGTNGWGEIRIEGQTFASGHGGSLEFLSEGTALADIYANTSKDLILRTNGSTERMRLTSSGNVGIGTSDFGLSSFSNWNNLRLGKTANLFFHTSTNTFGFNIGRNFYFASDASYKYLTSDEAETIIFSGGNIDFNNATSGTEDASLTWNTRMRITNGGNVLIGTTTDSGYKLDVNGTARISNTLNLTNTTKALQIGPTSENNTNYYIDCGNQLYIRANQSGTDNQYTNLMLQSGTSTQTATIGLVGRGNDSKIYFQTSNTTRMEIKSDGKVGIGTSSPAQELDVSGNINASGDYYANGTQGYTGTVTIQQPSPNPPINIDIQGGIITNVY